MRPVAFAVNQEVGRLSSGVRVLLLAVEVWTNRVVLHLAGREDAVTADLQERWQASFDHWAEVDRDRAVPPAEPSTDLVDGLAVSITDASGSEFQIVGAQTGGQFTEWSSTRIYRPSPVGTLRIQFRTAAGLDTVTLSIE